MLKISFLRYKFSFNAGNTKYLYPLFPSSPDITLLIGNDLGTVSGFYFLSLRYASKSSMLENFVGSTSGAYTIVLIA